MTGWAATRTRRVLASALLIFPPGATSTSEVALDGTSPGAADTATGHLPCELLHTVVPKVTQWLPKEVLHALHGTDTSCDIIFITLVMLSTGIMKEASDSWDRYDLSLKRLLDLNANQNNSAAGVFGSPSYNCLAAEVPLAMNIFGEVADFLASLSLLHSWRCFDEPIRTLLARFQAAVAKARSSHSLLMFRITRWGRFVKPGHDLEQDLAAVRTVLGSLNEAALAFNPHVVRDVVFDRAAEAGPPAVHDASGAFSETTVLERELAGGRGWYLDHGLLVGLVRLFPDGSSVGDFGAGSGHYSAFLNTTGRYSAYAFDGTNGIEKITAGKVLHARFDIPDLWLERRFDWVLCFEMAEHIPKASERAFLENLARHATVGIVLSWSLHSGPDGVHANPKASLKDVEDTVRDSIPFEIDASASQQLRDVAAISWFRETVTVFRRTGQM